MSQDEVESINSKIINDERDVECKLIYSDPNFNCRGDAITPGSVITLADDIKNNPAGLMQRILIQPWKHEFESKYQYRVLAGNRRFTAISTILKWKTIPCRIITGLSEEEAEIINFEENLKRLDLNMLQEAQHLHKFHERGMTTSMIAKRLDVGTKWVSDRLALLSLPEDVQKVAAAGIIKAAHIEQLIKLKKLSPDKMYEMVRKIKDNNGRRKIIVKSPRPQEVTIKRQFRNMSDVFKVQDIITGALGTNLASKALAYVIGEISVLDLFAEVKRECDLLGIPWSVPQEYIEADRLEKRKLALREYNESIEVDAND